MPNASSINFISHLRLKTQQQIFHTSETLGVFASKLCSKTDELVTNGVLKEISNNSYMAGVAIDIGKQVSTSWPICHHNISRLFPLKCIKSKEKEAYCLISI